MEDILWKIFEVCAFITVILGIIVLNFWVIIETYGKITTLCEILKAIFCASCLFASICIICLVIVVLFLMKD